MKIKKQKNKILILVCLFLIGFAFWFHNINKNDIVRTNEMISFKKGFYYRITPWDKLEKGNNLYFEYQELTKKSLEAVKVEKKKIEIK